MLYTADDKLITKVASERMRHIRDY
jgi:hypothetical protein